MSHGCPRERAPLILTASGMCENVWKQRSTNSLRAASDEALRWSSRQNSVSGSAGICRIEWPTHRVTKRHVSGLSLSLNVYRYRRGGEDKGKTGGAKKFTE